MPEGLNVRKDVVILFQPKVSTFRKTFASFEYQNATQASEHVS